jgi:hypothetical protein
MPFVFFAIAIMMIVIGVRGTQTQALALLKGEFTGNGNWKNSFLPWLVAIGVVGGIGYIPQVKKVSDAFIWLCILAFVLANGKNGLFSQFNSQVQGAAANQGAGSGTGTAATSIIGSSTLSGGGSTSIVNPLDPYTPFGGVTSDGQAYGLGPQSLPGAGSIGPGTLGFITVEGADPL